MSNKEGKMGRLFQELKIGDNVAIVPEKSEPLPFPKRFIGRTGMIEEKRGKAYIVRIKGSKEKRLIIKPCHLSKLK